MVEGTGATAAKVSAARQELKQTQAEVKEARRKLAAEQAFEAERQIKSRTITVITTALALVAALFWQTAITDTIKNFIPISGAWQYELAVALGITLLAAVVIYLLASADSGSQKK
jgi:hypothetical protein